MQQTKWIFDLSHSRIGFSVRHFGITDTAGYFRKFDGSIITAHEDFSEAQAELVIDVNSVSTNDSQRDTHLLSEDFFDAGRFPQIRFKTTRMEKVDSSNYKLHGELTIKDVTRHVELNMEFAGIVPKDPYGNTKAGFYVSGSINRKEWGVTWNVALDHGGVAVSDIVKISCPVQLLKVN
jgi:polyisoprenoid-binding protein YceI